MAILTELACNLIQGKLRTLVPQYLQHAPDQGEQLTALHDAQCPYAMTWPTGGEWSQKGGGYKMVEQECTIFVFIESLAQRTLPLRTVEGTRVRDQIMNMFVTASNIQLDDGSSSGYQIYVASRVDSPQTDSGLRAGFPHTGSDWFGFSVPLKVRIQWIV